MQRYREKSCFKRCVSYASRAYDRQNKTGFDYDVPPVYLIGLMGVNIKHTDDEYWKDRYILEYTFREKSCHDLIDETIVIIAELARFYKGEDECETDQDRVLYLLKNSGKMEILPSWSDEDMYDEKRHNGELAAAREDGYAEGISEGRTEIIQQLLASGMTAEDIASALGVSVDELK